MANEIPDGERFRFLVEVAFTVTGRGTAVVGYVESGVARVGDRLRVMRPGGRPILSDTCWAIEAVNKAGRKPGQPPPIALLFRELQKSDFDPGDIIVGDTEGA